MRRFTQRARQSRQGAQFLAAVWLRVSNILTLYVFELLFEQDVRLHFMQIKRQLQ